MKFYNKLLDVYLEQDDEKIIEMLKDNPDIEVVEDKPKKKDK